MHFTGKILVVIQLVLSIAFMAFAGVVYTAHMNWRTEALKEKEKFGKKSNEFNDLQTQMDAMKNDFTTKLLASEQKATGLEVDKRGLETELKAIRDAAADGQVALKTSSEQALIATEDAQARKSEADNLRGVNHTLTAKRDVESGERIHLEDANRAKEVALDAALKKNVELIRRLGILQQALEAAGLTADVTELAARNTPPPAVSGDILEIRPAKRQGATELVQISLGSDDGLKKGHKMTIYRSAQTGKKGGPVYLGQLVIKETSPDSAVGEIIESSRNGVIQKGDHVTTKL